VYGEAGGGVRRCHHHREGTVADECECITCQTLMCLSIQTQRQPWVSGAVTSGLTRSARRTLKESEVRRVRRQGDCLCGAEPSTRARKVLEVPAVQNKLHSTEVRFHLSQKRVQCLEVFGSQTCLLKSVLEYVSGAPETAVFKKYICVVH
jgi:hypothetical protein